MITDEQFYDLFEDIASKNKAIGHSSVKKRFFKTPDDVPEKELAPDAFYMVMFPPEYEYADRDSDNILERFHGTFLIFKSVDKENYGAQLQAVSDSRKIARQILSILKKKRMERIFNEFTVGTSKGDSIGPILENCFGVSYTFKIGDGAGIFYNPQDWFE